MKIPADNLEWDQVTGGTGRAVKLARLMWFNPSGLKVL